MYIVSEDVNGRLTAANAQLKNNLKIWLNQNRMINDTIDVLDAKIVNYGINYSIVTESGVNKYEVVELCNRLLRRRYNRVHDIGEPFHITEIYSLLGRVDGVADVVDVEILQKTSTKYSSTSYDFDSRKTPDGRFIGVPDNVVMEIKYPLDDIKGTVK